MKEHIAAVHKQTIAQAAERLFLERGFDGTSISDICAASGYSRRTVYRYFDTKEEILYYIVANGLEQLRDRLTDIVQAEQPFLAKYEHICKAMRAYYEHCPVSARAVHQFQPKALETVTPTMETIFSLGTAINDALARWIEQGIAEGVVRETADVMMTVYVFSAQLHALFDLVETKGAFLLPTLGKTKEQFFAYGQKMIFNSLAKEPLR
ncbi:MULTISPECIES: TetR/AcrR family transcriptional regulator [Geobacillus]|jgi:AcrR family transcriptional regulator|uniref:Putative transcriptional regulator n=2 Tax=Geobacillus thermodenitrificans TaxID=33940 RepID=A4IS30_GEOTN|nr:MULTISPECIES: TetR/AcrR family transcriptional regulator [Geobacillus]ABO68134.1 Putative transcriptional regulator [Geobacillus thermodenitrificans NG80-2]ARP43897.1 HTH-type transcriptional repressor BscR [Geobacillus thermodenitrificans]ATO38067.1 TetR family transcriptional regulator [Geobacillus thermodenitrificans]KQB92208.1 TetR family transcriptional regulator [Geobacillus sp. PA-3]MED3716946.1 TetR/AcrR family transcriptional regulator [Geobacillus thermodenitrificans]